MLMWFIENAWLLWLAAFLILAAVETLTLDLYFIMLAVAAFAAMLAAIMGAVFWLQVLVFAVVALCLILFLRPLAMRYLRKGPPEQRSNIDLLIGQSATVLETVTGLRGQVRIGGDIWSARGQQREALSPGSEVRVIAIDGATAVVTPASAGTEAHTEEKSEGAL
ncbi:NfeD family protein [Acaricomes phytoseiuli]|uniref:NfeD family protein n=1 Tax=Acaricomes phytoseiuli TaxID=291968 RepID=UPI0003785BAF|nr:NfeD family protein [Acaricomes phytoseiuli]MCW1248774.1 NfeD family protein [Acaricomes phytoseiuli]